MKKKERKKEEAIEVAGNQLFFRKRFDSLHSEDVGSSP